MNLRVREMKTVKREVHKIDAAGKICGRLAVEVANLLRGRHKPQFTYHQDVGDTVYVYNLSKLKFTGRKMQQKKYWSHSGYPGHLKVKTLQEKMATNPKEVFYRAVSGMLPKNRLRSKWLKRLKLFEGEING